ncbi:hypothetical protein BGX33_007491 [Mortierella sp. NVP41]|nr:hypothetical protein BGX33_007491 [Mortierella sp. NVP41]
MPQSMLNHFANFHRSQANSLEQLAASLTSTADINNFTLDRMGTPPLSPRSHISDSLTGSQRSSSSPILESNPARAAMPDHVQSEQSWSSPRSLSSPTMCPAHSPKGFTDDDMDMDMDSDMDLENDADIDTTTSSSKDTTPSFAQVSSPPAIFNIVMDTTPVSFTRDHINTLPSSPRPIQHNDTRETAPLSPISPHSDSL